MGVRKMWYSFSAPGHCQIFIHELPYGGSSPGWSSGSTWIPVEPLPMTTMVLPVWSKPSGQRAVWMSVPWKAWRSSTSGHFQLLFP